MSDHRREILKAAKDAGWRVREGKKHVLLYPPNGNRPHSMPRGAKSGANSGHYKANFLAALRRDGLDV